MGRAPLRLTPPLYHVLLTLAEGPSQGYALIGSLAERRGGRDQEGQPRERHRVSRRVETPFEFQVPGNSAEWKTLHLVLQEVDGPRDPAAELNEPLCF